jgi:hypothetical protein
MEFYRWRLLPIFKVTADVNDVDREMCNTRKMFNSLS